MNPLRERLHKQIAHALGCAADEDYHQKKNLLVEYLRRVQPQQFTLEGGRKRAFERMAAMEGVTVEEKLEDLALTGYLLQRSFLMTNKEDALAALADCGVPAKDLPLLEKILGAIYGGISSA
jgi:hypothetical protein